jgi:hypothetical protein
MKRLTLQQKAAKYVGRSYVCNNCPLGLRCIPEMHKYCSEIAIKAYKKGYEARRKEK